MKLGPHVIIPTERSQAWARAAPIVKALDDPAPLIVARADAIRVWRAYFPEQAPEANPYTVRDHILASLKGYNHLRLYCELFNEVSPTVAYVPLFRSVTRLLHEAGYKVCGPSWSTGSYSADDWVMAKGMGLDAFSLHGYWANQGFSQWNALRYRQFWKPGDPPVIITECGRDAIEGGLGGWKRDGLTATAYTAELARYGRELEKDPYVLGATVFTGGRSDDPAWQYFYTDELDVSSLVATTPVPPLPTPVPPPLPAPIPAPPTVRLWLAILPSNQDRNRWYEGSQWTHEMAQMALLAARTLGTSRSYPAVLAKVFTGKPESQDTYHLESLEIQQMAAKVWLDKAPAGTYTVALNLHSDSGTFSHVGGYWRRDVPGWVSKNLAARVVTALLAFWPKDTSILSGDYSDYLFAQKIGRHCPVLIEVGSHQNERDLAIVREKGFLLGRSMVKAIANYLGIPI